MVWGQNTIQTVILYHLNVTAWLQCRPFLPKISHLKIEMTSWGLLASINIRSFLISPHFLGFPSVCHWSCCNCHSGIPATEGTTPSRSLCTKTLWQFLCTYTSCITPKKQHNPTTHRDTSIVFRMITQWSEPREIYGYFHGCKYPMDLRLKCHWSHDKLEMWDNIQY